MSTAWDDAKRLRQQRVAAPRVGLRAGQGLLAGGGRVEGV